MTSSRQIRAARSLLDWSQKELARVAGVSELSIVNLENGKNTPQQGTMKKIMAAFELYGIGFTEHGVEEKDNTFTIREGEKWYLTLLEDVERTFAVAPPEMEREWILIYPDERISPPWVIEGIERLRMQGIKRRHFVKQGNTFLPSRFSEYRYIPEKYFDDARLIHCYADKVAILDQDKRVVEDGKGGYVIEPRWESARVTIFRNAELADLIRSIANMLWDVLPEPTVTTATYRFGDVPER